MFGGRCCECGYCSNAAALDFDHKNRAEKQHTISMLLASDKPSGWALAISEAAKCEIRCSNCHRERTYPEWELGHSGLLKIKF